MTVSDSMRCRGSSLHRGLSLVEMVISTALVGIALVAALNTVGSSRLAQNKVSVWREGHLLAQALMSEILQQDYADVELIQAGLDDILSTGDATYTLGPDSFPGRDEVSTGDRSLFNDVDDYDGWSASPPQPKEGPEFAQLQGWERSVSVVFTSPSDLTAVRASDFGWKRITVTVTCNNVPAAELVALKTIGLPWLEACCFDDGSCEDLRAEACAAQGGTAQGPDANCANTECPTGPTVLLVVTDDTNPTAPELARQALMESWEFSVTLIAASAWQSDFDEAVADADVAYVNEQINPTDLGTKLRNAQIGVVNEVIWLQEEFGIGEVEFSLPRDEIKILNNTHYITSGLTLGYIPIVSSVQPLNKLNGLTSPDYEVLAEVFDVGNESNNKPTLGVLEPGAALYPGGGVAAARRVQLAWGDDGFVIGALNADGQTIMKRAIEWAAGMETVCGDGTCDVGEDSCNCPDDCGDPVAFEEPGVTCADGLDNDCDGATDCDDINCPADPTCITVCGDTTCEGSESPCNCPTDCGEPASWELANSTCDDGIDNDCDGQIDCADSNCTTDPTCCKPKGSYCVMNSECCSGDCNAGKKECK